ncbi:BnaCnng72680D [Brassica napus]|uniref:(rape) hypothetical protein n=1 Tax=Brassica napus TaxID=3708 RepID=A0A078K0S4_BRANA|nr:unnamed protein product [Brassica napus]CDY71386.1 BnaCnng72680D [Brassica napus]
MSSNRRRNTNSGRTTNSDRLKDNSTPSTETTLKNKDKYKWSYIQEKNINSVVDKTLIHFNYTLKHTNAIGGEYMVNKFNLAFSMNVNHGFFKNKLDELKKNL